MTEVDELLARITIEKRCAQLAGVWFPDRNALPPVTSECT